MEQKLPFHIAKVKQLIYDICEFKFFNFHESEESKEYEACIFQLEALQIISRTAKITPKKVGQFVTVWKRNSAGITTPFHESDPFDFIVVNVKKGTHFGQFVFPKSVLIQKRIVATVNKDGKRGIRVYPPWDLPISKQAIKTQTWQLHYFLAISVDTNDVKSIKELYF
ncbi:MepB family protein [uncultured Kordia sp.]|uniref:MepB family protein n=1 Tax=uncultured Kordia sp. TaxID=507699 RepID=UPI00261DFF78|nr:MepB family protein [uncultured Kordia sp.]